MPSQSVKRTPTATHSPTDLDPVIGLEKIRRSLGLSKATFYRDVAPTLPVIMLSARRRGVSTMNYQAWLAARTRQPIAALPDTREA